MKEKKLIMIAGATASGKTALAIKIAKQFNTVILSADSRQLYNELNIGTAKPSLAELNNVKHYFINHISIHQKYDVGTYRNEAITLLNQLFKTTNTVVMCGGTGLYIRAISQGLDEFPDIPAEIKQDVNNLFLENGLTWLQQKVLQVDPEFYHKADIKNPLRLLRALDVYMATGIPLSKYQKKKNANNTFDCIKIGIDINRDELYERINKRVDSMVEQGLEQEVKSLIDFKYLQALQTVGYKEWFDYFNKKTSLEKTIDLIKQNTRNYAKRQVTWFKKEPDLVWLTPSKVDSFFHL